MDIFIILAAMSDFKENQGSPKDVYAKVRGSRDGFEIFSKCLAL